MLNIDLLTTEEKHIAIKASHVDTEAEEIFRSLLEANDIKYQQEVILGRYRADFIIDNFIYEINGGYHNTTKQRKKDKTRATYLLKRGYEIKEISNDDVFRCRQGDIALSELCRCDSRCISDKFETCRKSRQVSKRVPKKSFVTEKAKEYLRKKRKECYQKKKEWLALNKK